MLIVTEKDSSRVLNGTTLDVYRLMLKSNKPLGIREIQRKLMLSSPSVAQYHLAKLEDACLIKRILGNYVVDKVVMENFIKVSRFLVPRYLFYTVFGVVVLLIELLFPWSVPLKREFLFYTSVTLVFVLIFCYETVKVWVSGRL